ncbi:MAG: hypothetical protein R8G66_09970 [Cytophagales bacterium]|nr:hypothetical protein [Cytophagales bacterium]
MTKKRSDTEQTPKWLKTIQLNSWEAELLISALVLYALFQVPDYLDKLALQNFARDSQLHGLFKIIKRAVLLLSFGYILHILVRGMWVASVGMSYVFPGGIDQEKLRFKGKFKKELSNTSSLVKTVLRLEELSSTIYGISFILFGTLVGFGTFFFSLIVSVELVNPVMNEHTVAAILIGIFILFYILISLIVFIDFITNGLFRRWSWSAKWFYYVAIFFRIITLSFLYRRSLLVLISNTKGWKSYLIPLLILTVTFGYVFLNKKQRDNWTEKYLNDSTQPTFLSNNYENLRPGNERLMATIQSDIVNQKTLRVFLKDLSVFNTLYNAEIGVNEDWESLDSKTSSAYLNKWLALKIDSTELKNVQWFNSQHPTTYEYGFTAFADLNEFSRGAHSFSISIDTTGLKENTKQQLIRGDFNQLFISNIHFFYDK